MHIVYVLTSIFNPERSYVGYTTNVMRRLKEHNEKKVKGYSNHYVPWKLVVAIDFTEKKLALRFERYLKSGSGHAFLKKHFLP
ncbi:MAG: GIY-YIG nuclease family protein [Candidatus Omnitrophica bacterium]|nr:GIY-YIG nuclease family protein [Candidatus Omnitrophota bacterium]MDD5670718.1 GIY-YIG nuclease family protein [Candidatus Omnitrophota bacterium]